MLSDARNTSSGPHILATKCHRVQKKSQLPEVEIEPGPQDLKANTLPRRCKIGLQPQGSRSVLYTYPYYIDIGRLVDRFNMRSPGSLILKEANLVFYLSVYPLLNTLQTSDYGVLFLFLC